MNSLDAERAVESTTDTEGLSNENACTVMFFCLAMISLIWKLKYIGERSTSRFSSLMVNRSAFADVDFAMRGTSSRSRLLKLWKSKFTRHSQSNPIELYFNRTQSNRSNSIDGLSSIEFGNRTKSNSHTQKNWTIERNRTFDFRTLDFCKTGVKNDNKVLEARVYTSV